MTETFYVWRVKVWMPDGGQRLLVPHANPHLYEYPFDYLFDSPEAAYVGLDDFGAVDMYWDGDGESPPRGWHPDGWILCRETTEEL